MSEVKTGEEIIRQAKKITEEKSENYVWYSIELESLIKDKAVVPKVLFEQMKTDLERLTELNLKRVIMEEKWLRIQKLKENRPKFEYGIKETESEHFHKLYHHIIELDKWFEELSKVIVNE